MLKKTHTSMGLAGGVFMGLFNFANPYSTFINFVVIIISSTLPDWDIDLKIKHRGFAHSILFGAICIWFLYHLYPSAISAFTIGYGFHILADTLTNTGVQLFYPLESKTCVRLFDTKDPIEQLVYSICYISVMGFILLQIYLLLVRASLI